MPKPKAPKLTPEERLNKALDGLAVFETELRLLLPAQLWPFVETLCRAHLRNQKDQISRDLVAQFALTCRQEALRRFGHDTLETFALARMLKEDTENWRPKAPRQDSITYINKQPNKLHRFNADQETAAKDILLIWEAFGKFLQISGGGIGGGGGARSQALGPVDVIGQELWQHHKTVFTPWQAKASRTVVERRTTTGTHLTVAAVVYKVLVEDIYPEELDRAFALIAGTALRALKAGLNAYNNPALLDSWGRPKLQGPNNGQMRPTQPQTPPVVGTASPAAQNPATSPAKRPPGLWQAPRPKLPPGGKVKLKPRKRKK